MRHIIILAAIATALVACKPQEEIVRTWMGAPEDKLVSIWGTPSEVFTTEDGVRVLVYSKAVGKEAAATGDMILPASGPSDIVETCETTFTIDAGRVVSYTNC